MSEDVAGEYYFSHQVGGDLVTTVLEQIAYLV